MTVVEAAGCLGVHSMTLHKWTREGKFEVTRLGRKNYLDGDAVRAFKAQAEAIERKKVAELISIRKAADYLGVHFTQVYRWVRKGKLHPEMVGWQMYLTIDDVETIKARLDAQVVNH